MKAERVVVDTNVLISALLMPTGKPAELIRCLEKSGASLLFSRLTFLELASRLGGPKFDRYRTRQQMDRYLEWLADLAEWVKPSIRIEACRDPDDNRFLEVLVAGEGDVLITGDADLLVLNPFEGRPIVSPGEFLEGVNQF
ncbi:MAG: putative toxin-antitoxin system toxin component, PIN family [Wenzhouxiangella sp.]|jgi:putative PIN family toxin of toxin-antitoxin system|nr:putative toxin-antitoxin system toxin component, PIN family [Wenzhouxiangella sp.]